MHLFALLDTSVPQPVIFFKALVPDIEAFWKLVHAEGEKALRCEEVSSSFQDWMDLYINYMTNTWHQENDQDDEKETPSFTGLYEYYVSAGHNSIWQFWKDQVEDSAREVELIQTDLSELFGLISYNKLVWTTTSTSQRDFWNQLKSHVREITQEILDAETFQKETDDPLWRMVFDYEPKMDSDADRVVREFMADLQDNHDIMIVRL